MKRFYPILFISSIILLAYYQLALMLHTLKWDCVDYFLPMRYFSAHQAMQGNIPSWNPFINLGFPHYADPQTGFWYPISWLFSLTGNYGFVSLNLEWLFHAVLAGIGMYQLFSAWKFSRPTTIFVSLVYALSGFMVGTAQILPFIIGAAWLPWAIHRLYLLFKEPSWKHALIAGLIFSLNLTGAYPAFTIILAYITVGIFVNAFIHTDKKPLLLKTAIGAVVVAMLLSSGFIYSFLNNINDFSRAQGLIYDTTFTKNSFTMEAWWSFIAPFSTVSEVQWFRSDMSLINGFIGFTTLILIPFAFVKSRKRAAIALLVALFCLAAANAELFPVRKWLYDFVPGMAHFKHPSIFRLYAMFALIMVGAMGMEFVIHAGRSIRRLVVTSFVLFFLILTALYWPGVNAFETAWDVWKNMMDSSNLSRHQHIGIQAGIMVLCAIPAVILMFFRDNIYPILLMVVLEMVVSTQMNTNYTIVNKNDLRENQNELLELADQLKIEKLEPTNVDLVPVKMKDIWRNKSIFTEDWGYNGYNPFMQSGFVKLREEPVFSWIKEEPLMWGKTTLSERNTPDIRLKSLNSDYTSKLYELNTKLDLTELVFSQNYHRDWRFTLNGKEVKPHKEYGTLMGIDVTEKGRHQVGVSFTGEEVRKALLLQFGSLVFLVLGIVLLPRIKSFGPS